MRKRRSGKMLISGLTVLGMGAAAVTPSTAKAAILYYNGDYDLNDAAENESKVPVNFGGTYALETDLVFDDFIVPVGQTWTLTSLFSDDQMSFGAAPTTATWQIRSGISAGNGGTLVASGDTADTVTQLHVADGNNYIDVANQITATVTGVTLTAGTYWMAVAPDSVGYYGDQSYNETTSGANSVGLPTIDGNSYLNNTLTGVGSLNYAPSALDYSAGVNGTSSVPEPGGSLPLVVAGIAGILSLTRRRNRLDVDQAI